MIKIRKGKLYIPRFIADNRGDIQAVTMPRTCSDNIFCGNDIARPRFTKPPNHGSLERISDRDLAANISRELLKFQLGELIKEDEEVIRDLLPSRVSPPPSNCATAPPRPVSIPIRTISRMGAVFFRNQDITPADMKLFMCRLSRLSGSASVPFTPSGINQYQHQSTRIL